MSSSGLLSDRWAKTLAARRDRLALIECATQTALTFADLETRAKTWERRLATERLAPGDRVIVKLPNSADFIALFSALLRLRLVMVPVDPRLGQAETARAMQHAGARLVVAERGVQRTEVSQRRLDELGPPPEGTVLLKLTSGSTGAPKGIALTDSQLVADSEHICDTMGIEAGDLNFGVIALSHSYGFDNLVVPLLTQGTAVAVLDEFLPRPILEGIASARATVFPAVPFLLEMLNELPPPLPDFSSVRTVISAGAPLTETVFRRFRDKFGLRVHQFYGSSECGGITYDRVPTDQFVTGCVGTPLEGVAVSLTEDERVLVRGPNVASGYFPRPAPGEEPAIADGAYLTGDLGRFDGEGRLHLLGRVATFINVAGRKVNPAEVEQCILQLDCVQSAAVLGVADASRHEVIAAFVVPRAGQWVDTGQLLQHCRTHLASWKVPRRVRIIDALPRSSGGKLDRLQLKKQVEAP